MLYILKVNGLLFVFYLAYYFLLRKETFFQSNRSFLLLGIATSFVLPLLSFTTIIWVDPEPFTNSYSYNTFPLSNFQDKTEVTTPFNWNKFVMSCYVMVSVFFLSKLAIELFSFFRIIRKGNKIKSEKIVLVETNESQNPFSFFNYLVINKNHFTPEELELILIHEKIHIQQKHSLDVLISKILCLLFWANPIIWLYRKAILENLEFIADKQTSAVTNKTYEYQKTLLKAVICSNQLSITNQFYQSLIKKRIVMLNTNPSSKKQLWKYSIALPLIVGFIFCFQIETIAQVKEQQKQSKPEVVQSQEKVELRIDKNSSDEEIKKQTVFLQEKYDITVKVSKIKRNTAHEIVALKIDYKDGKGNSGSSHVTGDEPIKPFIFFLNNTNGKRNMGFQTLSNTGKKPEVYVYHNDEDNDDEDVMAYSFSDSDEDMPAPPMPPAPPSFKGIKALPAPPSPPNFPKAPAVPSNLNNEKDMKKFEEKMAAFEMSMQKMQPQMEQFEKEMEKYEMQMEGFEPDMKAFEKEMEKFEKEMEVYQEKMMKKHQYAYEEKIEKMQDREAFMKERKEHQEEMMKAHKEVMEAHKMEMKARKEALKKQLEAEKKRMKAEMEREKAEQKRRAETLKKI